MRRLALSVLTACGLAILAACSGGTGLSTGGQAVPTFLTFTNGAGQSNDFFVAPGGALQINATAEKGNGPFAVVVPDRSYLWSGRFVDPTVDPPSVANYVTGPVPNAFKRCPAKPSTTPTVPFFMQGSSGRLVPLGANQPATVYVGAVPGVNASSYCLLVLAQDVASGVIGTITVFVGNSP